MELLAQQLPSAAFDTFYNAMNTLFCVMMSASWSVHMYDSIKLFNPFLFIYFIGFYIIVVIIILNLFFGGYTRCV